MEERRRKEAGGWRRRKRVTRRMHDHPKGRVYKYAQQHNCTAKLKITLAHINNRMQKL